jgi:hypothetical protein
MSGNGDDSPQPDPERTGADDLDTLFATLARGDHAAFSLV